MKSHHRPLRIMPIACFRSGARAGHKGKQPRRHRIAAEQFRDARAFAGFTREQAAEFLNVSLRTIGHWETGKARPSYAAFKLLRVYRHGDLIDPTWSDYRLIRGKLVTPEGHMFAPHEMSWLSLLVRRSHAMSTLLAQRDGRQGAGQPDARRASAAPALAPGFCSLGLSNTGTTRTGLQETAENKGFSASCVAAKMGPQWGHEQPQARYQEVQSETPGGSDGSGPGTGGRDGNQPQRVLPAGDPEFHRLHGQGVGQDHPEATAVGVSHGSGADRKASSSAAVREGRPERSVSVRQRAQGQALSPRSLLMVGGAP